MATREADLGDTGASEGGEEGGGCGFQTLSCSNPLSPGGHPQPSPGAECLNGAPEVPGDSFCGEPGMSGAWAIPRGEEVRYPSRPLIAGEKERESEHVRERSQEIEGQR